MNTCQQNQYMTFQFPRILITNLSPHKNDLSDKLDFCRMKVATSSQSLVTNQIQERKKKEPERNNSLPGWLFLLVCPAFCSPDEAKNSGWLKFTESTPNSSTLLPELCTICCHPFHPSNLIFGASSIKCLLSCPLPSSSYPINQTFSTLTVQTDLKFLLFSL